MHFPEPVTGNPREKDSVPHINLNTCFRRSVCLSRLSRALSDGINISNAVYM